MTKAELHKLVDDLPEASLEPAAELLRILATDSDYAKLLAAPLDDEPYTDEQRLQDEEATARIDRGEGLDWREVRKGLKAG